MLNSMLTFIEIVNIMKLLNIKFIKECMDIECVLMIKIH